MRNIFISCLSLFLFACASTPELPPSSSLASVDFIADVKTDKAVKLLHWSDDKFYLAQADGSVQITNKQGLRLASLPTKNQRGERILEQPEAAATYGDTVYVVDSELNQVVMFTQSGEFLGVFGRGNADMQLSHPLGITIHEGIVYVADSGNSRIQLYGINGVFVSELSINDNKQNQKDSKNNDIPFRIDEPTDIELDALGRIYILDNDDELVKIYDQRGRYISHLPEGGEPVAISISKGGIFVANLASYSIYKYGFDFGLDFSFGSKGQDRGQFMSLSGMAVNGEQEVFVGDSKAGTVHLFTTEVEQPLLHWQRQATRTSIEWLGETKAELSKFVWSGDSIFAIERERRSIVKIEAGEVVAEFKIKGLDPVSIAVNADGQLLVIDRKKLRIVRLSSSGKLLSSFGSDGSGAGQFDEPVDIAVSSTGLIFVADLGNRWVQVFNQQGIFLNVINKTIDPKLKLQQPIGIALDPQDNLYVLDSGSNNIFVFTPRGEPKASFVKRNISVSRNTSDPVALMATHSKKNNNTDVLGNISDPVDLMATDSEILLLEQSRVKVYSKQGEFLRSWGGAGGGIGQFKHPTAISVKDNSKFAIADSGNDRLQHFSILHKPKSLTKLSAKGAMHAVELQWAPIVLPFIKHYQVYRAETENGRFKAIATSSVPSYLDVGLEAEHDYYYRVNAVSDRGYEGTLNEVVSATTSKFIPHEVKNLQTLAFAWQVKLSWEALDESYSSSYRIYKKSGEVYIKIAESSEPEFIVGSLEPESDYTFYVSAISSDNIESKKVAITASTLVASSAPLEIEILEMQNVFSNTYKIYEQDGIGRIKLTNNTGGTMENIKVAFTLKNFMDFPSGIQIDRLEPRESKEIIIKAVFNNNILKVTEDTPVQTELNASYFDNGIEQHFSKNHSINVYEKHRLSWDDPARFASFITPKDPLLINYVRSVATQFKDAKIQAQWAAAVFNSFGVLGLTYIQDPNNPYQITSGKTDFVDYIQYPRETLERKSGDCDDLVALYSASLESLGVETLVLEVPGHMLMMFNTGIPADADAYTMDDMYVIHDDMLWIPVETTVVGSSFLKAWEMGSQNYYKWAGRGLNILNIKTSWRTYKPASLPHSSWKPASVTKDNIESRYPGEYLSVLKIGTQTKTRSFKQAIKNYPDDLDAHLQIGIILGKAGDHKESMKYFDKIIKAEPRNAAALNNRGNLLFIGEDFEGAVQAYVAATELDATDAYLWINLAKTYKLMKLIDKAKQAFSKAVELEPLIKKKYRVMSLELLNTL